MSDKMPVQIVYMQNISRICMMCVDVFTSKLFLGWMSYSFETEGTICSPYV